MVEHEQQRERTPGRKLFRTPPRSEDAVAAGLFAQIFAGDLATDAMAALRQMYGIDAKDDDILATHYDVFIHQVPAQGGLYLTAQSDEANRYLRGLSFYLYRYGIEAPRRDFSADHLTNLLASTALLWEQDGALGKQFLSQNVRTWLLPLMGSLWQHRLGPFKEPLQDYANWAAGVCRDTPAPNLPETKCFDPDAAELETFKTYLLTPVLSGAFFSHQEIRQWGRVCGFSGSPTPRSQTFTALLRWAADRDQVVELLEHISASCQAQWQWREEQPWLQMQFDQAWQNKLQMTQKNLAKMAAAAGDLFLHAASETEHS